MSWIIETQRLRIRHFTREDAPFIIQLTNSEGWLRFIGNRNTNTETLALNYLENGPFQSYQKYGYGLSMVELKHTNEPVGMCGILHRDTLPSPDIGFALLPSFAGEGYAFEMASAMMHYASETLKITQLMAIVLPENTRSIRLLQKLGMGFVEQYSPKDSQETLLIYQKGLVSLPS